MAAAIGGYYETDPFAYSGRPVEDSDVPDIREDFDLAAIPGPLGEGAAWRDVVDSVEPEGQDLTTSAWAFGPAAVEDLDPRADGVELDRASSPLAGFGFGAAAAGHAHDGVALVADLFQEGDPIAMSATGRLGDLDALDGVEAEPEPGASGLGVLYVASDYDLLTDGIDFDAEELAPGLAVAAGGTHPLDGAEPDRVDAGADVFDDDAGVSLSVLGLGDGFAAVDDVASPEEEELGMWLPDDSPWADGVEIEPTALATPW